MRPCIYGTVLITGWILVVGCERDRRNDSMAPLGLSASPRPVGIEETTVNRDGRATAPSASVGGGGATQGHYPIAGSAGTPSKL